MEQGTGNQERGFRRLVAWQKADDLASAVFSVAQMLPLQHRWLRDQAARAAVSVPANISEGYGRGSLRDYLRFLDIARGSLAELEYYLHFLRRNGLIEKLIAAEALRAETGRLLFGLTQSLREKLKAEGPWQRGTLREEQPEYMSVTEE
jgi:four helix bundle protein